MDLSSSDNSTFTLSPKEVQGTAANLLGIISSVTLMFSFLFSRVVDCFHFASWILRLSAVRLDVRLLHQERDSNLQKGDFNAVKRLKLRGSVDFVEIRVLQYV